MKIVTLSDELLNSKIAECKANNRSAQHYIYTRYASKMHHLCLRYTSNTAEAEDILQMGFIKIFTKIDRYTGVGSFEGWMRQVMVNTALDVYKRNQKRVAIVNIDDFHTLNGYGSNIDEKIEAEFLMHCLQNLQDSYRIPFNMHIIEGYSHKEIAEKLNISIEQSRIQVSRARQKLKGFVGMTSSKSA